MRAGFVVHRLATVRIKRLRALPVRSGVRYQPVACVRRNESLDHGDARLRAECAAARNAEPGAQVNSRSQPFPRVEWQGLSVGDVARQAPVAHQRGELALRQTMALLGGNLEIGQRTG